MTQVKITPPFIDPGPMVDDDLELILVACEPGAPSKGWVPAYHFEMRSTETGETMGWITFRIQLTAQLNLFGGNLGYEVYEAYRGHHYAARSCLLLKPLALAHGLGELWLTCDPRNSASCRSCELAGAELVDTISFNQDPELLKRGRRETRRYRIGLSSG